MSEVWEQYDMNILSVYKGRGVTVCTTNQGIRVLQPFETSESRLQMEDQMKNQLYETGFQRIDRYIRNREQQLVSYDRYHMPFVMKEYYEGRECNIHNEEDMRQTIHNLAVFHQHSRELRLEGMSEGMDKTERNLLRHNQELKRVRSYIRKTSTKTDFDLLYISCFDTFYQQALETVDLMKGTANASRLGVCHGAYHQHNVLFCKDGIATINFDHFTVDNQLTDLYTFLRKALEKNGYSISLLTTLLGVYSEQEPLQHEDYRKLYLMLRYPEKFWKISNHYNNNNKA